MSYIINPSIFYWMSVLNGLKTISIVLLIISSALTVIFSIMITTCDYWEDDENERARKILKCTIIVMIVLIILIVFIPGKETMIEMLIAKTATVENTELTIDAIKGLVDYIVESLKAVK